MKQTLLFIAFLFLSSVSLAQTNTWIGGTDSNWDTNANWSLGTAPADDTSQAGNVLIPSGSTVVLRFGTSVNNIVIEGNANFTHLGVMRVLSTATIEQDAVYNWNGGRFTSGGIVTNYGTINMSTPVWVFVESGITINNYGNFNVLGGAVYLNDGTINNQISGTIDFKNDEATISFSTATIHLVNNYGLITKSSGSGMSSMAAVTNNYGTIVAAVGTLDFAALNNWSGGIVKGHAAIKLPFDANFSNEGTFAPGMSPGTLTAIGNFKSTAAATLAVELNGPLQGTDYDLLAIQGNAIFNGTVVVNLGFAPEINDTFTIATTTGTITECNVIPTATATFGGYSYTFSVACITDNQLVLTVSQKTLGVATNEFHENNIILFPNPTNDVIAIKNNSNENISSIEILDSNGRSIEKIALKNSNQQESISFQKYSAGSYFIKLSTEKNKSITKQIIKL